MTAIEEMAGMDVLCSDKTGTLSLNKLTVNKNKVFSIIDKYVERGFRSLAVCEQVVPEKIKESPGGLIRTYPILGSYRFISPSVELTQKASLFEEGTPRHYKPLTNPILGRCGIITIPHPLKNQRPRWSRLCWSRLAPLFGSKPPLRARWSRLCWSRLAPFFFWVQATTPSVGL
ncbi:hypothetical protein Tco_0886678 [Tanacetum coccineum]